MSKSVVKNTSDKLGSLHDDQSLFASKIYMEEEEEDMLNDKSKSPEFSQSINDLSKGKTTMKKEISHLKGKLGEYVAAEDELIEFNKELQWTLMMLKKDNDSLRDNLEYLV